jgi:hypothetical protein
MRGRSRAATAADRRPGHNLDDLRLAGRADSSRFDKFTSDCELGGGRAIRSGCLALALSRRVALRRAARTVRHVCRFAKTAARARAQRGRGLSADAGSARARAQAGRGLGAGAGSARARRGRGLSADAGSARAQAQAGRGLGAGTGSARARNQARGGRGLGAGRGFGAGRGLGARGSRRGRRRRLGARAGAGSARADPGSARADPTSARADPGSARADPTSARADPGAGAGWAPAPSNSALWTACPSCGMPVHIADLGSTPWDGTIAIDVFSMLMRLLRRRAGARTADLDAMKGAGPRSLVMVPSGMLEVQASNR